MQSGVQKVGILDRNDPANVEIVGRLRLLTSGHLFIAAAFKVGTTKQVEHCRSLVSGMVCRAAAMF